MGGSIQIRWKDEAPLPDGGSPDVRGRERNSGATGGDATGQTAPTTRIEPGFHPASLGEMKAAANRDLMIGGATLAAPAFGAGLVDECHPRPGPRRHLCQLSSVVIAPVAASSSATSTSFRFRRWDARRRMSKAWSAVRCWRSMRIPLAWPITSRVWSA